MKIQTRTTLVFTIFTSVFLIALDIVVYYFINKAAQNDFNKRVELRARISAQFRFEEDHVSTEAFREIQRRYLERLPEEQAFVVRTDSIDFHRAEMQGTPITKAYLEEIIAAGGATVYRHSKFRHYAGILYNDETGDYLVVKSATNQYGQDLMNKLRNIMLITLVFFVAISYIAGHYFSKRSFGPFRRINNQVRQINENNLHLRLEETKGQDEIAELTTTFNRMLDRIEMAFATQNNFISNASHELRTPLTTISAEAELALSRSRSEEEYRESLRQVVIEANKLQHLTQGLLNLAQTGFDGTRIRWQPIRLDELLYEVKSNVDDILPGNQVKISFDQLPADEGRMTVKGSYDLLKIALSNIVLNACKYSGNQEVLFRLSFSGDQALVLVTDRGIGIPQNELKYIYDPFFRASNAKSFEGYGIGMPLARNIINLHKGVISIVSALNEGTTVEVKLPAADQS